MSISEKVFNDKMYVFVIQGHKIGRELFGTSIRHIQLDRYKVKN